MLFDVLPQTAYIFILIFSRIGTLFMLMPGFSERAVSVRMRLILAVMVTLVFFPMVSSNYGSIPVTLVGIVAAMVKEMLIAAVLGLSVKFIMAALQIASTIIAFQLGLSFAMGPDPSTGQQTVQLNTFMSTLAITLIFVTNLHYLMIAAMYDSYEMFPVNQMLPLGDIAEYATQILGDAFIVGLKLSSPFIAYGLVFYFGLGLLSRLMPQLQVFFIAMPANILVGTVLFMMLLVSMMSWYMGHIEAVLGRFIVR
ncbi:flagellar biosynthetic protein FliR [Cohaesibacter celericrescens]|uniref:Flagellar biosynthetic protein FliR n=1 Tax=Cohaesibacter celericrescens TaxID=2067669 RepID=A0A2N5XWE9_9HYPH|nr:flagellar biosynthetic protein FliR [Cohaesibacter celericrescens]PLW78830.1 flagellar type III secretion system protein FliR [Cohaesibacter celericrescens]